MSCGCTDPCQPNSIPCTCEARVTSDCVTVSGATSNCLAIDDNLLLTDYLTQMDDRICEKVDSVTNFIALENVGTGSQLYKGDNLLGKKQIRTVKSLDPNLVVTETDDEIQLDLNIPAIVPPDGTETKLVSGTNTTVAGNGSTATPYSVNVAFPTFKTIEGQSVIGAGNIDLDKNSVGLGNVDNTSDLNKIISTATQTALDDLQLNKEDKGVNSSKIAYVESVGNDTTAELGNFRKPFLTINAALDALPSTGGIIRIGIGTFLSPLTSKVKSNCKFFGSGKPNTDSTITIISQMVQPLITSPTKLLGGTILLGTFDGSLKDNIEIHDLGVDCGLDYCNTYKAGVAQEGVFFAQLYNPLGGFPSSDGQHQLQTLSPPRKGVVINNVSALCMSSTALVHAMLVENTIDAKISNVSTYFGVFGLVIKSIGATAVNYDGHGHGWGGVVIKSNDYAYGFYNNISNVLLTSILPKDGAGFWLWAEEGIGTGLTNISNVIIKHVQYGFKNTGVNLCEGFNIDNVSIYDTSLYGIDFNANFVNSNLSNIDQRTSAGYGVKIVQNYSIDDTKLSLVNISCSANSGQGLDLSASNLSAIYTHNLISSSNPGGDTITGLVYGNSIYNKGSVLTGSLKHNSSSTNEYISTLSASGNINKSNVRVDVAGNLIINPISGNPHVVINNEISGLFTYLALKDTRAGGTGWNIENGRVNLGSLEFLNGIGGTVFKMTPAGNLKISGVFNCLMGNYANDAEADADTNLLSGSFYKITGNRTVFQKP